jgi:hypothetical protein
MNLESYSAVDRQPVISLEEHSSMGKAIELENNYAKTVLDPLKFVRDKMRHTEEDRSGIQFCLG